MTDIKSRDESVQDCIQHNSHLVYVETSEEQIYLAENLRGNSPLRNEDYWLGLLAVDVTYIWMNGDPYEETLPTIEERGGNCVFLTRDGGSVRIQTGDCSEYKYSICEWTERGMSISLSG